MRCILATISLALLVTTTRSTAAGQAPSATQLTATSQDTTTAKKDSSKAAKDSSQAAKDSSKARVVCDSTQAPLPLVDTLPATGVALALAVLYWIAMVLARWNRIAHPTRELLNTQIASVEKELSLLTYPAAKELQSLLQSARSLIGADDFADQLFWSRGKELAGWGYVHEAQVQMAAYLRDDTVRVRLQAEQLKLVAAKDPLAAVVDDAIKPTQGTSPERLRALLAQALSTNYDREDTSFAAMVSWQNKTAWLVVVGLVAVVALALVDSRHSILLLVGALGGLLSRLSRSLDRADVPTDYGASWATLFLSPVAGALAAWAGVLLSGFAVKTGVLGDVFSGLWCTPPREYAMAAALIFGFSERWFDTVIDQLTQQASSSSPKKDGGGAAGQGAPPGGAPGAPAPQGQSQQASQQSIPTEPPPNIPRDR